MVLVEVGHLERHDEKAQGEQQTDRRTDRRTAHTSYHVRGAVSGFVCCQELITARALGRNLKLPEAALMIVRCGSWEASCSRILGQSPSSLFDPLREVEMRRQQRQRIAEACIQHIQCTDTVFKTTTLCEESA